MTKPDILIIIKGSSLEGLAELEHRDITVKAVGREGADHTTFLLLGDYEAQIVKWFCEHGEVQVGTLLHYRYVEEEE